jgi:histone H3/H4
MNNISLIVEDIMIDMDIDPSILTEEPFDVHPEPITSSPFKLPTTSVLKLVRRAGVTDSSPAVSDYTCAVIYTELHRILKKSLIMTDQRGSKILDTVDILNASDDHIVPLN